MDYCGHTSLQKGVLIMDYAKLADLLFPHIIKTPADYEAEFPKRELPEGAVVTRIGPSPTGFVHLGNLFNAIIGERLAHQSNGVIFLRIEDTDQKREVPGAVSILIDAMTQFGVYFDEGATVDGDDGNYGPYRQRQRKDIYQCFAKLLVQQGMAYPCFCSAEELDEIRAQQENEPQKGYWGKYAKCRSLSLSEIEEKIKSLTDEISELTEENKSLEKIGEEKLVDIKYQLAIMYEGREQIYCYSCMIIYKNPTN